MGDKLLTYYEAAISIFFVAAKPSSSKMKKTINKYAIEIWENLFSCKHDLRRKAVI